MDNIIIIVTRLYKILDGLSTTLHCLYIVHKDVNFKFEKTICKVFTKDCKRWKGLRFPSNMLKNTYLCCWQSVMSAKLNLFMAQKCIHFHLNAWSSFKICLCFWNKETNRKYPIYKECQTQSHHPRSCSIEHKICQFWNWCRSDLQTLGD